MQDIDDVLAKEFDGSPKSADYLMPEVPQPHPSQRKVSFAPGTVNLLSERAQNLIKRSLPPQTVPASNPLPAAPIMTWNSNTDSLDKEQQKAFRLLSEAAVLMQTHQYDTYEEALRKYREFLRTPAHVAIDQGMMLRVQEEADRLEAWLEEQRRKEKTLPPHCQTATPADCRECKDPRNKNRAVCKVATPVVCSACDKLRKGIITLDEYRQIMAGDAMHNRYAMGVGKSRRKRRRCKKKPTRKRKKKRTWRRRRMRRRSRKR